MRFIKRPIVVVAEVWTGHNFDLFKSWGAPVELRESNLDIKNLNGIMYIAEVGDYIVKGIAGEYYPVRPEIFKLTYIPIIIKVT